MPNPRPCVRTLGDGCGSPQMGLASKVAQGQGTNEFSIVAPAKAGAQRTLVNIERQHSETLSWIPACAGMTVHLVDAKFIILRQGPADATLFLGIRLVFCAHG